MAYEIKIHKITDETQKIDVYPIVVNGVVKPMIQGDGKIKTIEDLTLCDREIYVERRPEGDIEWVLPHSKKFPNFIATHFSGDEYVTKQETYQSTLAGEELDNPPLFPYQKFIYDYLRYGTPYRGLLLEHGLGSGKTRSAIEVAESFRAVGISILVLTPAFLATNFEQELIRWVPEFRTNPQLLRRYYHFVSYNATGGGKSGGKWGKGSVFEQLARLGIGFPPSDQDSMDYINKNYRNLTPPKNMFIIIDEAHGLNRSFISATSKVKAKLYRLLMMAEDCKLLFLSATPMVSNPFELAPLYNILRGSINNPQSKKKDGRAFTEHEGVFIQNFIARDAGQEDNTSIVINDEVFMRHILGLTSFLKGFTNDETGLIYPKKDEHTLNLIMSSYQSLYHDDILQDELEKAKFGKKKGGLKVGALNPSAGDQAMTLQMNRDYVELKTLKSSYRTGSRQACNFAFPSYVPRPRGKPSKDPAQLYLVNMHTHEPISDPFEFKIPEGIDVNDRLIEIYDHLTNRNLLLYEGDYPDGSDESIRLFRLNLTHNIVSKFDVNGGKKNYLKADDPLVTEYLTDDDYYRYVMVMGDNKERMAQCLKKLAQANAEHKCFNMNPNPEAEGLMKYSVKMYNIYKSITTDIDVGASYVSVDNVDYVKDAAEAIKQESLPEKLHADEDEYFQTIFATDDLNEQEDREEDEESTQSSKTTTGATDMTTDDEKEERIDATTDSDDLPNVRVPVVLDEFDPFTNPDDPAGQMYKDVYLTDAQLDKKYGKGNWVVKGGQALVYSFYNTVEGAGIFSMVLNSHGFTRFDSSDVNIDPTIIPRTPRYAFIRGGMTAAQKIALLKVFNHKANMHGQLIKIIFVTQAAAEGISLYNVRQVHIMEPFWDNVIIRQVAGRAFRLRSHYHLPFDERIVHVFHLLVERSAEDVAIRLAQGRHAAVCRGDYCAPTTDFYIKELANRKDVFQEAFLTLRQQAAVDCHVNRHLNELEQQCFIFPVGATGNAFDLTLEKDTADVGKKRHVGTTKVVGSLVKSATGAVVGIHTSEQVMANLILGQKTFSSLGVIIYEVPPGFQAGMEIDTGTLIIKGIQMTYNNKTSVIGLRGTGYSLKVTSIMDPTMEQRLIAKLGNSYQGGSK